MDTYLKIKKIWGERGSIRHLGLFWVVYLIHTDSMNQKKKDWTNFL